MQNAKFILNEIIYILEDEKKKIESIASSNKNYQIFNKGRMSQIDRILSLIKDDDYRAKTLKVIMQEEDKKHE